MATVSFLNTRTNGIRSEWLLLLIILATSCSGDSEQTRATVDAHADAQFAGNSLPRAIPKKKSAGQVGGTKRQGKQESDANRGHRYTPADRPTGEFETPPPKMPAFAGKKPPPVIARPRVDNLSHAPQINPARVAMAGIRKIEGTHLDLYTDLPAGEAVDSLPLLFDLAVPQWCKFFGIDVAETDRWKMTGYLIDRQERFAGTGLLPADLPPFLNGYQRGAELWSYEQPSVYYRRHMLLHEGTHAFMRWFLGGSGPPWYSEGMAELLATHHWVDGALQLAYFPKDRDEVPQLGRVKIVQMEYAEGRGMSLDQILHYGPTAHLQNEPYGWCWAATAFLDGHPDYQSRFRQMQAHVRELPELFSNRMIELLRPDLRRVTEQWQLFVVDMDYGYDLVREAIVYEPVATSSGDAIVAQIQADRGWQSTGIEIQPRVRYRIEATGRYQLADQPSIWWCEPGGVTIRYHRGLPLGILLAAVSDQSRPLDGMTDLTNPEPIGLARELVFSQTGTLFLRINDYPAELEDNAGQLSVRIVPAE